MTTIVENEDHLANITNNLDLSAPRKQQTNEPDEGYLRQTFNNLTIDQSLTNLDAFTYSNLSTSDQRPVFSPRSVTDIGEHYQSPLSSVQQAHVYSSAFETPFTPSFYDQAPVIITRNPSIDPNPNTFQIINEPSNYY